MYIYVCQKSLYYIDKLWASFLKKVRSFQMAAKHKTQNIIVLVNINDLISTLHLI